MTAGCGNYLFVGYCTLLTRDQTIGIVVATVVVVKGKKGWTKWPRPLTNYRFTRLNIKNSTMYANQPTSQNVHLE